MPKLRPSHKLLALLAALWLVLFTYHEHIVPRTTAARCQWAPVEPSQTNVLLVADPQLIDNHTYVGRNELLLGLSKHTVDVYIKQNYRALVEQLKPDRIFFLGDYLDNGRLLLDVYYEREFARFEAIFARWPQYKRGHTWFTDVPGNHDVGFGDGVRAEAQARFAAHFGSPNAVHLVNGVQFVLLDTPSYSLQSGEVRRALHDLVSLLMDTKTDHPRVLLSHVPLYRDTEALPCGPLRESARFDQGRGYQYQLALDPLVLAELLGKLKPQLVFLGDDHDYCDVQHVGLAREVTVKSISMAMGIRYPAVQLLSYVAHGSDLSYDTHMCYLPPPYRDIVAYVTMAVASAVTLAVWLAIQRKPHRSRDALDTAQKVSAFLEGAETGEPVPQYTVTVPRWAQMWYGICSFCRRWHVGAFFRHAAILGAAAVAMYLVLVWLV